MVSLLPLLFVLPLLLLTPVLVGQVLEARQKADIAPSFVMGTAFIIAVMGLLSWAGLSFDQIYIWVATAALLLWIKFPRWNLTREAVCTSAVFLLCACYISLPHLYPALAVVDVKRGTALAEMIYDIDHWFGAFVGLAGDGLDPKHYQAPSAQFLYYFGGFVFPASMLGLFPSGILSVMAGAFILSNLLLMSILYALFKEVILKIWLRWFAVGVVSVGYGLCLRQVLSSDIVTFLHQSGFATQMSFLFEAFQYVLYWQWHHVMAMAFGLAALLYLYRLHEDFSLRSVISYMKAGMLLGVSAACSLYVFFCFLPYAAYLSLQLLRKDLKKSVAIGITAAFVVLPFYWAILGAVTDHNMSGNGFISFRHPVAESFLDAFSSSAVFILALILYRPKIFTAASAISLCVALTSLFYFIVFTGEFSHKAYSVLQLAGGIYITLSLIELFKTDKRSIGFILLAAVALMALGGNTLLMMRQNKNAISNVMRTPDKELVEMIDWIGRNTPVASRVSVADTDRTFTYHILGRRGVEAGTGHFARAGAQTASVRELKQDDLSAQDVKWGWEQSDYVFHPTCGLPMGFTGVDDIYRAKTDRLEPPVPGYDKVYENGCGTIWRHNHK